MWEIVEVLNRPVRLDDILDLLASHDPAVACAVEARPRGIHAVALR